MISIIPLLSGTYNSGNSYKYPDIPLHCQSLCLSYSMPSTGGEPFEFLQKLDSCGCMLMKTRVVYE